MAELVDRYDYRVQWDDEDACFIATVLEFPSLAAHGDSPAEALEELRFVVAAVLDDLKQTESAIPEPLELRRFSGNVRLRMPPTLHRDLVREAAYENVSLNSLILRRLAQR